MGFLIGFPLFIVAPCVLAGWLGARCRIPAVAFFVAWLATPCASLAITVLGMPVLRAITPPENDGTGAIMLPFFGVVTGVLAGIGAAVTVQRRRTRATAPEADAQNTTDPS